MARKYDKAIRPAPVYIATYADGHRVRMSFFADRKKGIKIDAARLQAERHRPVKTYFAKGYPMLSQYPLGKPSGEFVPMISFYVEHLGQWIGGDRLEQAA